MVKKWPDRIENTVIEGKLWKLLERPEMMKMKMIFKWW